MDTTRLLLLFFAVQGRSIDTKRTYCTEQRGTIRVEEKGAVTIPCNFTHPKYDGPVEVRVSWRRGRLDRCGKAEPIYDHTAGWTHNDYRGRISLVGNPTEGTATILINNLRRTDGPMFCCRIEIYNGSKLIEGWHNQHGTVIQFKDEFSVEQTDVVLAMIGEDIIVPCSAHYVGHSLIEEVTWTVGSSVLCIENSERTETWKERSKAADGGRWSVVDFPHDLSLRIKQAAAKDGKQYCCTVKRTLKDNKILAPFRGTEVIVFERDPMMKVIQPAVMSPDEDGSATLNCSYKSDPDAMWTVVFWRVGSPAGPYAYHPFPNMVDPKYRGRTELIGPADLHIKGVEDSDNTTYYCFVILKFCVGANQVNSVIQYGQSGTRLEVEDTAAPIDPGNGLWLYIVAAALPAVFILCAVIIIIILKKRGVICQKRSRVENVNYLTSDIALKDQNPYDNVQTPNALPSAAASAQEDSGGILYAHLNVSSLEQKTSNRSKESKPDDSQVLYAAVKPINDPQDIYSTVGR